MTFKINFDNRTINKTNLKDVKTPSENNEHIVFHINKKGQYEFLIPFVVDIKNAIIKDYTLELDIVKPENVVSTSLVSTKSLSPSKKQLDKLKMLPGQVNEKNVTMQRVKKRMQKKEIERSFSRSGGGQNKRSFDIEGENSKLIRAQKNKKTHQNNKTILRNIHDGIGYKIDALKINETNKIKKIKIDYTKKISNKIARSIKRRNKKGEKTKTDNEYFGTKNMYVLGKPSNPGVNNSSVIFTPNIDVENNFEAAPKATQTPDINARIISNNNQRSIHKSVENTINRLYLKGIDPAEAFEGIPSHRSTKHQKRGTKPKIGVKSTGKKKNFLKNLKIQKSLQQNTLCEEVRLVRDVIGNNSLKIKNSSSGPGSFDSNLSKTRVTQKTPFVYSKKVVDKNKVVYLRYIHNNMYMFNNKVNFVLNVKNKRGLIIFKKNFNIDVNQIMQQQTTILDDIPNLKVINSRFTKYARIEVQNGSSRSIRYKVYRKIMSPIKNSNEARFEQILEGSVSARGLDRQRIEQPYQIDCMYRMTYEVQGEFESVSFSNFSNDSALSKDPSRGSRNVSLFARNILKEVGIRIEVSNLPPDTDRIKLLRKRTCLFNNPNNRIVKQEYVLERDAKDELIVAVRRLEDDSNSVYFIDKNVIDNTNYEYQVEILLKRGTKYIAPKKARETYEQTESLTIVDLKNNPAPINSGFQVQEKQILNLKGKKTISDNIIESLSKNNDVVNLFKDDLEKIKVVSNTIKKASVSLINKTTGDVHYIGELNDGDTIEKPKKIKKGCEYVFKIEPYEFSPKETIETLAKSIKSARDLQANPVASQFSAAKKSALVDIKKSDTKTIKKNRAKFFSRRRLKKASLMPADPSRSLAVSRPKFDFVDVEKSGDTAYFDFDTNINLSTNITPQSIYVSPFHKVILSFSVQGSIGEVDFYVISAEKEGNSYPVGSAHCDKESKTVNFLDYVNCDYLGVIDYYVQPVYENGTIGTRQFAGRAALINKFENIELLNSKGRY